MCHLDIFKNSIGFRLVFSAARLISIVFSLCSRAQHRFWKRNHWFPLIWAYNWYRKSVCSDDFHDFGGRYNALLDFSIDFLVLSRANYRFWRPNPRRTIGNQHGPLMGPVQVSPTAPVADLARSQGIPKVFEGSRTPSPSIPPPLLWFDTDEDEGKLESRKVGKLGSWRMLKSWEVGKLKVGKLRSWWVE